MKTAKKLINITNILIVSAMLTLTHCAETPTTTSATGDYNASDVGKVNKVVQGVIISGRKVNVYNKPETNLSSLSSNEVDTGVTRKTGYEYVIRLDSGAIVSVVQTEDLHLQPKQHILVIYGATTRVVADEGSEG